MASKPLVLGPMLRYVDQTTASIWVETVEAARIAVVVAGNSWQARTFAVHGHHYALVEVDGLEPGSAVPYRLEIDGVQAWPEPDSPYPAPMIRTLAPGRPLSLAFGSCRTSTEHDAAGNRKHGVDALRAYALHRAASGAANGPGDNSGWPDLVLFLGDQVYADSTTEAMQDFIRSRRDIKEPPGEELKDYQEYAHLYMLAWSDGANRWLLSTVPSAMIFDDHDIRDDWNASLAWRRQMEATSWWHGRIVSGLTSYWVYQHLGNLSPEQRAQDELWQQVASHSGDGELDLTDALEAFAERADQDPETYRWSFTRDIGGTRLVVVDSRAARELEPERRSLLDQDEMAWLDGQLQGGFKHLLIGTSLPFLLPQGLHHIESWNEALSEGAWGKFPAAIGERLRQAVDLEHWAAFQQSFRKVAGIVEEVADGGRGPAPETVTFLSGDVHFSYVSEVQRSSGSRIVQAVCSPVRNPLPRFLRYFTAVMSYGVAAPVGALVARGAKVPKPPFDWKGLKRPWFDNNLASLEDSGDGLRIRWETGVVDDGDHLHPRLKEVAALTIAPRSTVPRSTTTR
ncbi:alkaline phosphatase D family protein [Arthrobacter sulfonylureivorans]|uniref:Alkaline phosphatase D family protein n=1 Tax=Arthrobacter sulfonylureivorans TaxID=2486855 RepID=A0ABY3W4M2_9MICC|nr:alkaline phosphatase D family protein [Arthrobacter sulfonylureivorans]UNK45162.1 alkaline phosphatase D family protein [Arthrobacter sulfonylureivorans]